MKDLKIIVNADDCGLSLSVNLKIEEYINRGLITSTTIMSNMPEVKGAQRLYELYKDTISFGIHLNLTEGIPMRKSQLLLDKGLLVEEYGNIIFNLINKNDSRIYSKEIEKELFLELSMQFENILSHDIKISHVDSHHHVHTRPYMLRILPQLQKKFGFTKVRRMRNYMPSVFARFPRNTWWYLMKMQSSNLRTTDWFDAFSNFIELYNKGFLKYGSTIELMTHPGGYSQITEGPLMENTSIFENIKAHLINYNDL